MKARNFLIAAAFMALSLLGTGCKKHGSWQAAVGTPVQFRAVSGVPSAKADTKTAYSDEVVDSYERLNWVAGDKVAIFMAYESVDNYKVLDYTVGAPTADGRYSRASVSAVGEAHEWQGEESHFFASLYPSPSVKEPGDNWKNKLDIYEVLVTYPAEQAVTPKGTTGADALTLLPDMDYAYMFALSPENLPADGPVTLSYKPVFTAFTVEISAGDNDALDLTEFRLVSHNEEEPLALTKNIYTDETSDEGQTVSVNLEGIQLTRGGDPLILTVLVNGYYVDPVNFSSLTLEFSGSQIGDRKLDLTKDGEWITFKGNAKHRISGLSFPALDQGSAGGQEINWNGTVSEDVYWHGAEGEDINWGGNKPYVLPGRYSISSTQAVNFSRGNLVYKGGEWDFHKQQYDRCFKENGPVEIGPDATFDLFAWATAGIAAADETMVHYQPWDYSDQVISGQENTNPYGFGPSAQNLPDKVSWDAYAAYCDWGNNYKLKQRLGSGWFTMSAYEWEYIFREREASTVNGIQNARFAKAKVNGLPGMLIFSDNFGTDYAGDQSIFSQININNTSKSDTEYDFINLSLRVWRDVEAAGAVFLAPTGALLPVEGEPFVYVSEEGNYLNLYWSSTSSVSYSDEDGDSVPDTLRGLLASVFGCEGREVITSEDGALERNMNCGVRLVKLAE